MYIGSNQDYFEMIDKKYLILIQKILCLRKYEFGVK